MDEKWFNINRNQDFLFVVGDVSELHNISTYLILTHCYMKIKFTKIQFHKGVCYSLAELICITM